MLENKTTRQAIGVDLGATQIKAIRVSESGEIFEEAFGPTEDKGDRAWTLSVRDMVHKLEKHAGGVEWIGLSAPGLADPHGRSIAFMPGRLQGLEGFEWSSFLSAAHIVPVLNDAHAALLGEVWKGAAAGCRNAILLTLGTGVGGAILSDGRLLKGHIGRAGHLGHISLNPDGKPDIVRTPGSLEDAIGECTLPERSGGRFKTTRELLEAHAAGDAQASEVWSRSVRALGCGIASLVNALDPEVVIIGGGVAAAGKALFDPLQQVLNETEWRPQDHAVRVVPAKLGELAGALGAAYNAINLA